MQRMAGDFCLADINSTVHLPDDGMKVGLSWRDANLRTFLSLMWLLMIPEVVTLSGFWSDSSWNRPYDNGEAQLKMMDPSSPHRKSWLRRTAREIDNQFVNTVRRLPEIGAPNLHPEFDENIWDGCNSVLLMVKTCFASLHWSCQTFWYC